MDFEQIGPQRAEGADGTIVELVDRHHAQLHGTRGTWLVELGPGPDEDWLAVTVYADSLLRAGGDPDPRAVRRALDDIVAGLRALRVRVTVATAIDEGPVVAPTGRDPDDQLPE